MKEKALELADELELIAGMIAIGDRIKWGQDSELMENGSAMIRRLVEELDKQKYQNELLENSIKFAMLANNLQDKQCEPYVWYMKSNDPDSVKDYWYFIDKPSRESKISHQAIPLYRAPQTKPLSDEEIYELYASPVTSDKEMVEFARALEERHGIK